MSQADTDWRRFYASTKDSAPWPLLEHAVSLLGHSGDALDLGAGAGRDTRYLLEHGFRVTAVDREPQAVALLERWARPELRIVRASMDEFAFGTYDLISSQFALPFLPPAQCRKVFERIKGALRTEGVFAGQFFGLRDQWNSGDRAHTMTFLSREQARAWLHDLDVVAFDEEDSDGQVADGSPQHWHVFHILARRLSASGEPGTRGKA